MATLKTKIEKYMGREVNFPFEVTLQDDGKGAYICEWNIKEKTKPTDAQLKAVESDADKEEKNRPRTIVGTQGRPVLNLRT